MMQTNPMIAVQSSESKSVIERAVTTHNRLFWGYVFVLVLTALFTWLVWWSGNRLQEAIRADADARIAEANERAGKAAADAASAKERTTAMELELAQQRERAAIAERSLLELQQKVADRRLDPKFLR